MECTLGSNNHVSCDRLARIYVSLYSHQLVWLMSNNVALSGQISLRSDLLPKSRLSNEKASHTSAYLKIERVYNCSNQSMCGESVLRLF